MFKTILNNTQLQALVNNLTTRAPKTSFNVAGTTYPASKVVSLAQGVLTARSTASVAKGNWVDARTQSAEIEDGALLILNAVRLMLVPMLINDTGAMTELGIAPRKAAPPLTAEQRLTATAKNRSTRAARGTASKKQKALVKGNVTGVVVTPVTSQVTVPVASPGSTPPPTASSANGAAVAPAPAAPTATPSAPAIVAVAGGAVGTLGH